MAEETPTQEEPAAPPSLPTAGLELQLTNARTVVGLELPFYATHVSRVLETVGGASSLQAAHEGRAQFLPVRLRPHEPSCKPLFADLAKTQSVLLRVRKRRRSDANGDDTEAIDAHVVGLVREKYVCEGMADFQYFTSRTFYSDEAADAEAPDAPADSVWHREPATGALCPAPPAQAALKASLRPYLRVHSERELEMIPEVFSKVDLPLKYEFRQRSGYQPTEAAKKTSSTMTYLNFHDDVAAPAEPKPENPALRRRPVGASDAVDEHVLRVLQAKLAAKPVWLRSLLFVGLDFLERRAARRLLRKLCYVFVDGPWRGSWIRMGYDPRKAPDSGRYQVIELRNNRELVHAKVTHPNRKRTKKFSGANPKGPRIVKVTQTSETDNAQGSKRRRKERFLLSDTRRANEWEDSDQDGDDVRDDASGVRAMGAGGLASAASSGATAFPPGTRGERTFEIFGVPLTSANVLFQLDDIDDDEVRAWTPQFAVQDKPTLLGGWYSTHMFLPLREMIRLRIAALVGRSKADLDLRRKRIDALKKQALADYASGAKDPAKGDADDGAGDDEATPETRAEDLEQAQFEESLVRGSATNAPGPASSNGSAPTVPVASGDGDENEEADAAGGDEDDHSLELDEDEEIRDDEEEEAEVEALARQQERLERGDDADSDGDDSAEEVDGSGNERGRKVGSVIASKAAGAKQLNGSAAISAPEPAGPEDADGPDTVATVYSF
ncbi:hypothetical protein PybrP1_011294 [[Pythium] brassicae (nom. inval.)]|nr:hypothetical protein PybrP1_011294 [[Pythium] brassicae (nom. inval.)]